MIVPYLSYRDAKAAIDFFERAFGLVRVQVYEDDTGKVQHAEMTHGGGMLMIGTADLPKGSPGNYLVVDDVDAHFDTAKAAGAEVVYGPEDTEFGTRRWRARDPEGHEWSFGTYRPSPEPPAWG